MKVCKYGLLAAGALLAGTARSEMLSAVQVVVNQDVITRGQILDAVGPLVAKIPEVPDQERMQKAVEKVQDEVVESMVERDLVLHAFFSDGYQTNLLDRFVDDYINDDIKKNYENDRSQLIRTLQREGISYQTYREQERDKIIARYENEQNTSPKKVIISPLKIQNYYNTHQSEFKLPDQVKLKMIAIKPEDAGGSTARAVAEEILRKIDSGVPFSEMASVYSSGAHRSEGGDRGWVDHDYLVPELADPAFALKPGQHSGIIELKNGSCYLLMAEDVRKAHVKPLSEVREDIERTLREQEVARLRQRWMDRLRGKSFVRFY